MDKKEFNLKCAKYLGIFYSDSDDVFVTHKDESTPREFDAYYDANDRNMVVEKMQLSTAYGNDDKWRCLDGFDNEYNVHAISDSMGEAQIKCIESVLRN